MRNIFKRKTELRVYGYDNCEGDKGVIIASSYDEAVRVYRETYDRKITSDHGGYTDGGCYLFELGKVDKGRIYVNEEW